MRDMFLGTPVLEQISETELRITGLSLRPNAPGTPIADATGTIGFSDAGGSTPAPDVLLPETFRRPSASFLGRPVSLAALVQVGINPDGVGPNTNLQPTVQKTGDGADFRIAVINTKVDENTQDLEIYLTLLGQDRASPIIVLHDSPGCTIAVSIGSSGETKGGNATGVE